MSKQSFNDGVAVITGAGAGLGAGIAQEAARRGMMVVVSDISPDRARDVADRIVAAGGKAHADSTDVRDAAAMQALAARVQKDFGDVGLLVNNAGIDMLGPSWELTAGEWANVININLNGVVHGVQAFLPGMLQAGKRGIRSAISNVSSLGGLGTMPLHSVYFASKHAVLAYTECLYLEMELLKAPVDISVIVPGPVLSSIYAKPLLSSGPLAEITKSYSQLTIAANQAGGLTGEAAAREIFQQLAKQEFWISTNHELTKLMVAARADHLRNLTRPEFPEPMRETLAQLGQKAAQLI